MNNLNKILLTGAALSVLAAVPATAAQLSVASPLKFNGVAHQKTTGVHKSHMTSTYTFPTTIHYNLHASTAAGVTYGLAEIGFASATSGGKCKNFYKKNKVKIGKAVGDKAKTGKYSTLAHVAYTFGGAKSCSGGTWTAWGPTFRLTKDKTGSDSIKWTDKVVTSGKGKDTYSLYYTVTLS